MILYSVATLWQQELGSLYYLDNEEDTNNLSEDL